MKYNQAQTTLLTCDSIGFNQFSNNTYLNNSSECEISDFFSKKIKSQVEGGEVKGNFLVKNFYNFFYNPQNLNNIDKVFTEYRFLKNFYLKNTSKNISELGGDVDL